MRRGEFIAFEGIDGSGKSTQSRMLAERIRALGRTVVLTREPGGTPIGEAIRSLLFDRTLGEFEPRAEALLHSAARAQHVAQVIEPALREGNAVVTDRFTDSTLAYQGGGNGLSLVDLETIQAFAVQGIEPDLRILIDVPPKTGLARRLADAGADAIVLSNHGGRQLDAAPAAAEVLPGIRERLGEGALILADGGVRSGLDIARMIALGADAVLVGRPFLHAAAAAGARGPAHLAAVLREELRTTMIQLGVSRLPDLRGAGWRGHA